MWVTVDLKQNFGSGDSDINYSKIPDITNATRRHLMFIHRCTRSVYNEYSVNTPTLMDMGHQIEVCRLKVIHL